MDTIRNFTIIAHIDHGKSTLADRMLEATASIEKRLMRDQVLDDMELERERGITIKMRPARMVWRDSAKGTDYTLNLIDTPGHIDFAYEVSRALRAVEGAVLLVDSTQGVQAQTLTVLTMAREAGLVIIPALSKIDSPNARIEEVRLEVAKLLDCDPSSILSVSGKTGEGVERLLEEIVERVPAPSADIASETFRSLVFDFQYSNHRGVIVYVRILDGTVQKGDQLTFKIAGNKFTANEVGIFAPEEKSVLVLGPGSIGYIVTGIKEPGVVSVGDTVASVRDTHEPYPGYATPRPVVWASVYPESQDDFRELKVALERLKLSDSSLSFEEESSSTLGRGFRCGLLGMLHLEIVSERLRREFNLELIITTPSITYHVEEKNGKKSIVYSPALFPEYGDVVHVEEPWVHLTLIAPSEYIGSMMKSLYEHEAVLLTSESFGDNRTSLSLEMPLRELMRNFFDEVKSVTSGYGSIAYEIIGMRDADVVRLDVLVAEEVVPAFTRVVARRRVEEEAERIVEKLYKSLPRQQFATKIQGRALGRILSSQSLSALRKDVTGYLYGGDITRKMKLLEKQKKGKKKLKARGKVHISQDVFMKVMRGE